MQTDDYMLAILPLARLAGDTGPDGLCRADRGEEWTIYREVLEAGDLGYRLYTYHGLVTAHYGEDMARRVHDRHMQMFGPDRGLGPLLAIIDAAVGIGAVTTPTRLGGITTPVELNVALALLLGLPVSPHYTPRPEQRSAQIARIVPEIDSCFADRLARARREMVSVFDWLVAMLDGTGAAATGSGASGYRGHHA